MILLRLLGFTAVLGLIAGLTRTLLRRSFPDAWAAWAGRVWLGAVGALIGGQLAWIAGRLADLHGLMFVGVFLFSSALVAAFALLLSAPIWAGGSALVRRTEDPSRRAFMKKAAGAVPVAAAATGPLGATAAMLTPVLRELELDVPDLPAGLDGLRILQLTDVHLGTFIDVDQVRAAVEVARPHAPDLVVLTGDIADDYSRLPGALDAVASLDAPLGAFGVFGNHEVYRGRRACREIYNRSDVRLLVEEGVLLERNGARLWLGGADDPATLGREHRPFLRQTVQRAMAGCPDDVTTKVLLSHRPEGFEEATRHGVTLTLAGHTHGAQAAFFGRSWLEWLLPDSYLLGHYKRGPSHLYTSAGLGHWFPFRLNCPCEVALVTLRGPVAA